MSELVVHAGEPAGDGTILSVSPASAGWSYVGFEVLMLGDRVQARRATGEREVCVVPVAGSVEVRSSAGEWRSLGTRADPWSGPPDALYLPPSTSFTLDSREPAEVALCWGPARHGGAVARFLPGSEIEAETRGHGSLERTVRPILMGDREAESLLVCEVLTPAGHWSSYPPHKHDRDAVPEESVLEETYYHRVSPAKGFALQRVYSDDHTLEETITVTDRDCVLVPRGFHTVSAPPGYDLYYLNVMAGPTRLWAVTNDPDHEWTLRPGHHR